MISRSLYIKMRYFLLLILSGLSCNSFQERPDSEVVKDTIKVSNTTGPLREYDFIDSIAHNKELSFKQMKLHTNVKLPTYVPEDNVLFTGDSVFMTSNGLIGAIIDYDDRLNCTEKILFIFTDKTKRSTDHMNLKIDCDRDPSAEYTFTDYRFTNDSSFSLIETSVLPYGEEKGLPNRVVTRDFVIRRNGKILSD